MNKRRLILSSLIILLIIVFIVPGLTYRITFEQTTKVYTAALDVTRLAKFFNRLELPKALEDYKSAGTTTAVITEMRGMYSEEHLKAASDAGYSITLVPDVTVNLDADIDRICQQYNVKYIKLQRSIWKDTVESDLKSESVCDAIEKYGLTVVLSETGMQLENIEIKNFDEYIEASNGNLLRTFNSYNSTNIDVMDYPQSYYQMYNSAYDRNTRFITVKQLDDEGFTSEENAQRTQECVRLFCKKMESHGFVKDGTVDYSDYKPVSRAVLGAAAALSVLMIALMAELLLKFKIPYLLIGSIGTAAAAFGITFIMPTVITSLYATLFATIAPSFCITLCLVYLNTVKDKMHFIPLLLSTIAIAVVLFVVSGGVVASLLTGPDYLLNNTTFRGVKLTLMVPIVFVGVLLLSTVYKKRSFADYKKLVIDAIKQIRWYHIALFVVAGIAAGVYLVRSGNVDSISFTENYLRNWLTEYFTARPRTKEILIGWPCFALYIYYAKKNKAPLLQWIFTIGASILFASSINTFCHVFTLAETMFMRIATGLLFGSIFIICALIVNQIFVVIFNKLQKKTA